MKIAIVGAGFAGLSLAWHLLAFSDKTYCTIFDDKGIGKGASGVASGLLHPFPAAATRYSFMGHEAMHHSLKLLAAAQFCNEEKIADFSGILKLALDDEEKISYSTLTTSYERVRWIETEELKKQIGFIKPCPALLIENGVTVFCDRYLNALWLACRQFQGERAELKLQSINSFSELEGYDVKILCCGQSIRKIDPQLKLQFVKGQILTCKAPYPLTSRSLIAKGYIAITADPLVYHIGSSYEHHYKEEAPSLEIAKQLILQQCLSYTDIVKDLKICDCRAGIRVSNSKKHLPIIKKYSSTDYAITAFGSRGLLYHGLIGKQLAANILFGERISSEFFLS